MLLWIALVTISLVAVRAIWDWVEKQLLPAVAG
jgi:hypothetical protein